MNSNFVDDSFDCARKIDSVAGALSELALCLHKTGNLGLGRALWSHADTLTAQAEKIRRICGDKTRDDLQEIQQASANMIKAALNVAQRVDKE